MPGLVVTKVTAMKPADVMLRAVTFFPAQKWRVKSQEDYITSFAGMPALDRLHRVMLVLLTLCLILPGVLYYYLEVRGSRREETIGVNVTPQGERCEVVVTYPPGSNDLITEFLSHLV